MGAIGLPGDLSSSSRFAKVAFTKLHSVSGDSENESVNQFFHILGEDAAMSMENMRLPYILLVVIRKKESTIIQPMIITRSVLLI